MTLSVLAFQRYMMVTRDRQFPLSTPLSTILTLSFIWTYTLLVSIPPVLGWGEFNKNSLHVRNVKILKCCFFMTVMNSFNPFSSCGVKWVGSEDDRLHHMAYMFYIYMFGFIIPVSIVFSSYLKIVKTLKQKVEYL